MLLKIVYTFEDHIQANVDLAARIHAKYPRVLIEMHDMIAGGSPIRHTPLYYTYGLPGSRDENYSGNRGDGEGPGGRRGAEGGHEAPPGRGGSL
jgi:hypothetical protein